MASVVRLVSVVKRTGPLVQRGVLLCRNASTTQPQSAKPKPKYTYNGGLGLGPLPRDISSPSFGHLVSSLSATTPDMVKSGSRVAGHTMDESSRTFARKVTLALMGVPVTIGTGIVACKWWARVPEEHTAG